MNIEIAMDIRNRILELYTMLGTAKSEKEKRQISRLISTNYEFLNKTGADKFFDEDLMPKKDHLTWQ